MAVGMNSFAIYFSPNLVIELLKLYMNSQWSKAFFLFK